MVGNQVKQGLVKNWDKLLKDIPFKVLQNVFLTLHIKIL